MPDFSTRPLGRRVNHDPRSLAFQVHADDTIATVRWERVIPVLDQGDVGSCTGNAAVGHLGTQPEDSALQSLISTGSLTLDESEALAIYSDAEVIDGDGPYPPNDNGSSGLSVAKAAKNRGLISGYKHMTSLAACQTAIQTGPFIIGINWYEGFDNPNPSGLVSIGGQVRGGHEVEVIGFNIQTNLWEAVNSWGTSYGVGGHFFFSSTTFTRLLAESGDATQFVPLSQPAPVPTPVPTPNPGPPPFPVPTPTPSPIVSVADVTLWAKVGPWTRLKHVGANHDTAQYLIEFALSLGLPTSPHIPEHGV